MPLLWTTLCRNVSVGPDARLQELRAIRDEAQDIPSDSIPDIPSDSSPDISSNSSSDISSDSSSDIEIICERGMIGTRKGFQYLTAAELRHIVAHDPSPKVPNTPSLFLERSAEMLLRVYILKNLELHFEETNHDQILDLLPLHRIRRISFRYLDRYVNRHKRVPFSPCLNLNAILGQLPQLPQLVCIDLDGAILRRDLTHASVPSGFTYLTLADTSIEMFSELTRLSTIIGPSLTHLEISNVFWYPSETWHDVLTSLVKLTWLRVEEMLEPDTYPVLRVQHSILDILPSVSDPLSCLSYIELIVDQPLVALGLLNFLRYRWEHTGGQGRKFRVVASQVSFTEWQLNSLREVAVVEVLPI